MSSDRIVERLKALSCDCGCPGCGWGSGGDHAESCEIGDAIAEIDRLRAEVSRLTDELQQVANEIALAESQEARRER